MKIRINKNIIILNIATIIMFLIVALFLDPFKENYSTLSLTTKGYLLFLFMGLFSSIPLVYETYHISGKKNAIVMFLSLLIGVIIPHDISYNLQGNLHMFNAYFGFTLLMISTFINLYVAIIFKNINKNILFFVLISIFISFYLYMNYMCVNTISELVIMLTVQISHMYIIKKL